MNKERRKRIDTARDMIAQASAILQEVCDEESEAFENLPEALQDGERGQVMQTAVGLLEQCVDDCSMIDDVLSGVAE